MVSDFSRRHIGPSESERAQMLQRIGVESLDELIEQTVPQSIRLNDPLELAEPESEMALLRRAEELAAKNQVNRSFIGMGYYACHTPTVIARNILENPGWYTQYTPYQAEIAQGRLEALLNFQTMVSDLCGLELANASLLDESTAAAEAMAMCFRMSKARKKFFVGPGVHPQTLDVLRVRAEPLGIELIFEGEVSEEFFGVLVQYPATDGAVRDHSGFASKAKAVGAYVVCACDLLALTLLKAPGEWGADVAIGSSQRFGIPLFYGGPHAAFFATRAEFKREVPGRVVGVSRDRRGNRALRLALQVREQHIKRARATSNICTAQVLLAVMAGMYGVYHGPEGLKSIAQRVTRYAYALRDALQGFACVHSCFFGTLRVSAGEKLSDVKEEAERRSINFRYFDNGDIGISLDEVTTVSDLRDIVSCFGLSPEALDESSQPKDSFFENALCRTSSFLTDEVFQVYHTETELLRYIKRLESKDLSLTHSMIPLGSCTMKLNATTEMLPVSYKGFSQIHPFVPKEQVAGYQELISELASDLARITGFSAVSLQPNAGSQGEYAGLLVIRAYHRSKGDSRRNICLIPDSAHGTNPASAVMAGMEVVVTRCDENGNVDIEDLKAKSEQYSDRLAALMVTYPSTHGVFEKDIREVCHTIHQHGGMVYMDGANLNAQVGICSPATIGADVCHLNLHKTFCIPHGGGGPGVGPIAVAKHLAPFLPGHFLTGGGSGGNNCGAVSAAPWGSAGILPISWAYIRMMGGQGLTEATKVAILNANYIAERLEKYFPVLYRGENHRVAHECILDLRSLKRTLGVTVEDIAKRLIDYGFHAPTVSWPVAETMMVEPTESESQAELDRFCDAMIAIRGELDAIESGQADKTDNPLKNAPHTQFEVCSDSWEHPYTRQEAAFPLPYLKERKFWPSVARVDNAFGDRNLATSRCC